MRPAQIQLPRRSLSVASDITVDRRLIAETGVLPPGLQFIQDSFAFEVKDTKDVVVEDANGSMHVLRVTGLFQEGDKHNANGRVYSSRDVLSPAVRAIQEDVSSRAVMGEYDHPSDAKIHLDRVSHLITKVWMEGRRVFGEAEIMHKVPYGAYLRGLFEHKARVGISSRGVGDMEVVEHGGQEMYRVMPGYAFVTWDAVAEPSVRGAILNIKESVDSKFRQQRRNGVFSRETYERTLVEEINKFFGLPKRRTFRSSKCW